MGAMARAFQSVRDWCRRRMRRILRRNRRAVAVDIMQAEHKMPTPVTDEAESADWTQRDTLVGSFRSPEQFYDNLSRNYYYFPAAFLEGELEDIQYIALYQSQRFFRKEAGIRYYGKVTGARRVSREEIDFPGSPDLLNEPYCVFTVEYWQELETPISIRDEGVYAPRKTNFFLLRHCTRSYELFHIRSAADYRLMTALNRALHDAKTARGGRKTTLYSVANTHFVAADRKSFMLTDTQGHILERIPVNSFIRNPRAGFVSFQRQLKNQ